MGKSAPDAQVDECQKQWSEKWKTFIHMAI